MRKERKDPSNLLCLCLGIDPVPFETKRYGVDRTLFLLEISYSTVLLGTPKSNLRRRVMEATQETASPLQGMVDLFLLSLLGIENTIAAYRSDLAQLISFLSGRAIVEWSQVTSEVLVHYVAGFAEQDYSNSTRGRKVASIKSLCLFLTEQGVFKENPASALQTVKVYRYASAILLRQGDLDRLLKVENGEDPEAVRDRAMFSLCVSGLRSSELLVLQVEDIAVDKGAVQTRGKNERLVQIYPTGVPALRAYLDHARPILVRDREPHRILFVVAREGGPLTSRQWLWHALRKHAKRLGGFPGFITVDDVRRSGAWHQFRAGIPVSEIQKNLGHSNRNTTLTMVGSG